MLIYKDTHLLIKDRAIIFLIFYVNRAQRRNVEICILR